MSWLIFQDADRLPGEWDMLAGDNVFLKRPFLKHLESVNPCGQSYNLLQEQGRLKAIYVDYRLNMDIFTFRSLGFRLPVRVLGIPCSVSKQGFVFVGGYEEELTRHFRGKKGSAVILNCESALSCSTGETLPACRLAVQWGSFAEYLRSMRSPYRYRVRKALNKWAAVETSTLLPESFDREMYALYEEVYRRSSYKLEKQPFNFFKKLPLKAKIIKASCGGRLLGFVLLVENDRELAFLFTGFDYHCNSQYDTYLNLLLEIVRYGTEHGFQSIDFGQTAEETKLKLGSQLFRRKMAVCHSNPLLHRAANRFIGLFSYKTPGRQFRVFRQRRNNESFTGSHQAQ